MRAPGKQRGRSAATTTLSVRLVAQAVLDAQLDGNLVATVQGYPLRLGKVGADAAARIQGLRAGLPLDALAADGELDAMVRRLAAHGLVEYRLGGARGGGSQGGDRVIIEPQLPEYWPRMPPLGATDTLALSRFAYLRRRGNDLILESPRAGALFRICTPELAAVIASLSTPQPIGKLKGQKGFPGTELLALLLDCRILFKLDPLRGSALRPDEGDDALVMWDFHDLLFHARSTEGRHANPTGGVYPFVNDIAPPPAVRPSWPGKAIELRGIAGAASPSTTALAKVLNERHSIRSFDEQRPITLAELAQFLDSTARVHQQFSGKLDFGGGDGPTLDYAARPYPSAGGSWELELYLAVDKCDGLPRGFYHYDAGTHVLVPIEVRARELDALLQAGAFAMGAPATPQILITIAARFGRVSWKYSSLAYALILKDVGVLLQTFYLMATGMGLGGCAVGTTNTELFAQMTGIEFHVEGPVGQFALGRSAKPGTSNE